MSRPARASRGLWGGKRILKGRTTSFSHKRTIRNWKPNVQSKRLYSEILDKMIRVNLTTSVLRTIDKKGGLDNYILETSSRQMDSEWGEQLRFMLRLELEKKELEQKGVSLGKD